MKLVRRLSASAEAAAASCARRSSSALEYQFRRHGLLDATARWTRLSWSDPDREGGGGRSHSLSEPGLRAHINSAFSMAEEGYGAIDRDDDHPHEPTLSGSAVVVPWWIMEDAKESSSSNNNNLDGSKPRIRIHRQAMNQEELVKNYGNDSSDATLSQKVKRKFLTSCACTPLSILYSLLPVLHWLPRYRVRDFLVKDIMAGFTVSIMHIPQGLAYGVLAAAGAINGLYVSAFPAIIYFFMGTSRHVSVGTFAVVSLLSASAVVEMNAIIPGEGTETTAANSTLDGVAVRQRSLDAMGDDAPPTSMEVLGALAVVVGVVQLLMGMLHLGILSIFMSEPMVSGFTTGAAVQVVVSQTKGLFDIRVRRYSGIFQSVYVIRDVIQNLHQTNLVTLAISMTAMLVCAVVHECVNARYKSKLKMPVPIDLLVIIAATAISYFFEFNTTYGVRVIGFVPTGFPTPSVPRADLMAKLILNGFVIAIVSFTIALSMAKLFAKRHHYQIDPNQELNALGAANVITSFLGCYPCAVSLSRSSVQEKAGGQTQVSALIASGILIIVMVAAGPLFRTLPNCILSAVIIVALKGMLFQVKDCVNTWKVSRLDALTWIITFTSVVILDIDIGIAAGIGFSVVTVILRTLVPYVSFLGNVPDTDIYLDVKRYKKAQEIPRVKIFHFSSALYFANRDVFKNSLMEAIIGNSDETRSLLEDQGKYNAADEGSIAAVILDCSACVYIDSSGIETLKEILKELRDSQVVVYFACCSVPTYKVLLRSDILEMFSTPIVFPTIHDAVLHLPPTMRPPTL
ncbi:sulfate anion transporter 1 isoform X1 [Rhipicephalus sanguineus]|uniref:sulfate anion transporter 1 isoform X1 n=2 Tax=Rhipicephalus sanguineus TaxID=34632 RepID=UPI0020C2D50D|nr:sulfate anion transporter 1 isoform X1 [Rhipicephalus sanguineus]